MSITLIVVMKSQVFAYFQTYQIAYSKYIQVFVYQLYLNKAVKNKTQQKKIIKEKKEKVYSNYSIRNEIRDNNVDSIEIKNMIRDYYENFALKNLKTQVKQMNPLQDTNYHCQYKKKQIIWGTHVHPWQIQVNVRQNQCNVVK